MSFKTYDQARKYLVRAGAASAPFVIAWHVCPISDENKMVPPPEHVEQHAHQPINLKSIDVLMSATSSSDLSVELREVFKLRTFPAATRVG